MGKPRRLNKTVGLELVEPFQIGLEAQTGITRALRQAGLFHPKLVSAFVADADGRQLHRGEGFGHRPIAGGNPRRGLCGQRQPQGEQQGEAAEKTGHKGTPV